MTIARFENEKEKTFVPLRARALIRYIAHVILGRCCVV